MESSRPGVPGRRSAHRSVRSGEGEEHPERSPSRDRSRLQADTIRGVVTFYSPANPHRDLARRAVARPEPVGAEPGRGAGRGARRDRGSLRPRLSVHVRDGVFCRDEPQRFRGIDRHVACMSTISEGTWPKIADSPRRTVCESASD